ncbi:MAG: hypothetical protein EZS28_012284 [Streblomastix strix]|uniref:SPRY domain-containing protein n=1 Tax=Streblomastix strix TaxID=222440 RepID=A0A5J4WB75_9EUKA|nr:MAG: hypothetical protein EZS28_012284 [Streblomastix strix]
MDHVSEYNVDEGLLGLGPDIFLHLLSEMKHPQDVRKFLAICKKFHKLQEHPRFLIQISPSFIIKEQSQGRQQGMQFIHSDGEDYCTIAIDPIIREGMIRIEIIFDNNGGRISGVGIADASCSFAVGSIPTNDGNKEKTVRYYNKGSLNHITNYAIRNQIYEVGQRIAIEVDMTTVPRRATFFVDDIEQPNYVIGIPSEIRFLAFTYVRSTSFTILKFEKLVQSTAKGVEGSQALEWGKEWK